MHGYLKKLKRFQHKQLVSPQYSHHAHIPIKYATKNTQQYATSPDTSPLLDPKETTYIQSITGSLLYYGRLLYFTIFPALNEIISKQSQLTEKKRKNRTTTHGLCCHLSKSLYQILCQ